MSLYSNMHALKYSNVETVIVFRSCCPILVTIIEYLFMGRAMPSLRSIASILFILIFAIIYCLSDAEFRLNGVSAYKWVILYLVMITFEMTYGKGLTSKVKMESIWGPVLYCNALGLLPMYILGSLNHEFDHMDEVVESIDARAFAVVLFTCIAATLIG